MYEGSYASGGASEGSAEWHGKAAWAWWCCVGSVGAVSGWEVTGECCGGRAVAGHAVAREMEIAGGGLGSPCASCCSSASRS